MNSKRQKKLWIFTELYYPEQTSTAYILTQISKKLSEKYDIEVICGFPSYDSADGSLDLEFPNLKVTRVKSFKGDKNNNLARIFKFVQLSIAFLVKLIFSVKKNDKVFIVTNPAPFLVFASFIKTFKSFELIILVHDVFPENTIPAGYLKNNESFLFKFVKKIFDKAYSRINTIIVLGRDMKDVFKNKISRYKSHSNIIVIENWADIINVFPTEKKRDDKKIVLQFAGNLGAIQGLESLLEVISKVDNPNVEFHFIGDGKVKSKMINFKNENNLNNVKFFDSFKRSEQNNILNNCDLGIVTLSQGMMGLGVPSKTYNILAAGKPIFYIGEEKSEIGRLINEYNVGYRFDFEHQNQIIDFLNGLNLESKQKFIEQGILARQLAEKQYSEEVILNKYLSVI